MATAVGVPWHLLDGAIVRDHEPLRRDLRRLVEHARSLERGEPAPGNDGDVIATGELVRSVVELNDLVVDHLWREETFLFALLRFPVLRVDPCAVRGMRRDHDVQLARLRQIRASVGAEAGTTRGLLQLGRALARLEQALRELITLEEHCLYAQALASSRISSGAVQ